MKAVVVHEYGGPEVLKFEEYPDPVASPGEVLISENVYRALASPPPVDVLAPLQLKGKTQAVPVYRDALARVNRGPFGSKQPVVNNHATSCNARARSTRPMASV